MSDQNQVVLESLNSFNLFDLKEDAKPGLNFTGVVQATFKQIVADVLGKDKKIMAFRMEFVLDAFGPEVSDEDAEKSTVAVGEKLEYLFTLTDKEGAENARQQSNLRQAVLPLCVEFGVKTPTELNQVAAGQVVMLTNAAAPSKEQGSNIVYNNLRSLVVVK